MKGKKICKRCKNKINIEQKAVMLMTFCGDVNMEKVYWHWECYNDWLKESLENKAKKIYADSMRALVPGLKKTIASLTMNIEENKGSLC